MQALHQQHHGQPGRHQAQPRGAGTAGGDGGWREVHGRLNVAAIVAEARAAPATFTHPRFGAVAKVSGRADAAR
jgi:hypothetical protein